MISSENTATEVVDSLRDIQRLPRSATRVRGSKLGDAEVLALAEKPFLETLDLSGSDLVTDASVIELRKLTRLAEVDLSFCNLITDRSLEALGELPALRSLSLNACYSITDAGLSALSKATSLETVTLWSCERVTDVGVAALSHLPRLVRLELPEFSDITDAGLEALAKYASNLEVLRLDHLADISGQGIAGLRSLKRLAKLIVQSCERVTNASIAALQVELPGCQIVFD